MRAQAAVLGRWLDTYFWSSCLSWASCVRDACVWKGSCADRWELSVCEGAQCVGGSSECGRKLSVWEGELLSKYPPSKQELGMMRQRSSQQLLLSCCMCQQVS